MGVTTADASLTSPLLPPSLLPSPPSQPTPPHLTTQSPPPPSSLPPFPLLPPSPRQRQRKRGVGGSGGGRRLRRRRRRRMHRLVRLILLRFSTPYLATYLGRLNTRILPTDREAFTLVSLERTSPGKEKGAVFSFLPTIWRPAQLKK